MELREYISKRRKLLGISQSDMAGALGYTDTAVSKIESGASTPPISILPSLANVLKIDLNDLLLKTDNPETLVTPNAPYDWKTVSLNLRAIRLANHLRQKEASETIGVNKRTLVTYEKGDACPNWDVLSKILALCPGKPSDFFYATLYPEIQASPSFRKRGPSPFFALAAGILLGGGLIGAILGPFASFSGSVSSASSIPFAVSQDSGSSSTSAPTTSQTLIPFMDELVVIGEDGIGFDTAIKPGTSIRVSVFCGQHYSEQMRKKTHFEFWLMDAVSGVSLRAESDPLLYPSQIVSASNSVALGTVFSVWAKAWLLADPTVVVEGVPLSIAVNDTGTLTD